MREDTNHPYGLAWDHEVEYEAVDNLVWILQDSYAFNKYIFGGDLTSADMSCIK